MYLHYDHGYVIKAPGILSYGTSRVRNVVKIAERQPEKEICMMLVLPPIQSMAVRRPTGERREQIDEYIIVNDPFVNAKFASK